MPICDISDDDLLLEPIEDGDVQPDSDDSSKDEGLCSDDESDGSILGGASLPAVLPDLPHSPLVDESDQSDDPVGPDSDGDIITEPPAHPDEINGCELKVDAWPKEQPSYRRFFFLDRAAEAKAS